MKSYRKVDETPREITYPCLMESVSPMEKGMIVLFHNEDSGIVVMEAPKAIGDHMLGYYSTHWSIGAFEPFYGSIVLEGR